MCVCSVYVNIFKHLLLRNHWADWSQISCEASLGRGNENCSNGPGHMTKMAAMPIYGKNHKKSSPEPKGGWPSIIVCSIGCSTTTRFVQMLILGWPWPILQHGQIWSLMFLYGKKVKQWIFQKLLSSDLKLATDDRSDKKFLLTSKLVPWGLMPPAPGLYTYIKSGQKKKIVVFLVPCQKKTGSVGRFYFFFFFSFFFFFLSLPFHCFICRWCYKIVLW